MKKIIYYLIDMIAVGITIVFISAICLKFFADRQIPSEDLALVGVPVMSWVSWAFMRYLKSRKNGK